MKKIGICLILFFSLFLNLYAETAEPYDTKELPQSLLDLRRFEIISLGALPFVMLDSTLVYSGVRWATNGFDGRQPPTPFINNSQFTTEEQIGIVLTSIGISVGIGLTDFIIRIIKRSNAKKQAAPTVNNNNILITPLYEDADATKLPVPEPDINLYEAEENLETLAEDEVEVILEVLENE